MPESRSDQLVPDLRRAGSNALQTVVAHGQELLFKSTPATQEDVIKKSFGGRMLSSHGAYPPRDIGLSVVCRRAAWRAPNVLRQYYERL
jgi:hypothetical protein